MNLKSLRVTKGLFYVSYNERLIFFQYKLYYANHEYIKKKWVRYFLYLLTLSVSFSTLIFTNILSLSPSHSHTRSLSLSPSYLISFRLSQHLIKIFDIVILLFLHCWNIFLARISNISFCSILFSILHSQKLLAEERRSPYHPE